MAPVSKDKQIEALKAQLEEKEQALEEVTKEVKLTKEAAERSAKAIADMEDQDFTIENGTIAGTGMKIMTAADYFEWSKSQGRIMGRKPNVKTKCTIEELRALINSNWTPKMVMDKHGLSAEDLKQLVWALSKRELRDKPIKYSIERDFFSKEG